MASSKLRKTIIECLFEIQSDVNDEAKEKALKTLVSFTKTSPSHRNLVAQNNEFIPSILTLVKSSSFSIKNLSLIILFNLSLNPYLKPILSNIETIGVLNSEITAHGSVESCKLAASVICSLAMLDKNKAVFGVANTVECLVKAVAGPDQGPATYHLLSSLAELVQFHGNCTLAVRSGAVGVLLRMVENTDCEDLGGTALAILGLLARFDEGLKDLTKTERIVSRMFEVLKGRCMLSKEGAIEVLVRVFDESERCLRDAMGIADFRAILTDLSVRGSMRAREKASLLMRKMIAADEYYANDTTAFSK